MEPDRWDLSLLAGEIIPAMTALWRCPKRGEKEMGGVLRRCLADVALYRST
jgi:hypothetical protein